MARAAKWFIRETREILPAFGFFLVAFSLLVVTDQLTTAQYGITPFRLVGAVVLALIVAKVILVTDFLPFVDAFRNKPLVYNTLWKTGLYAVATILLRYAERLVHFTLTYHSLGPANRHLMAEVVWPRFWAVQIWLVVLLMVFVAVREISRKLGPGRLSQAFFGA